METIGLRINQSGKEKKLEDYIKKGIIESELSKTDAIKEGLYKAIKFDEIEQDYNLLQDEFQKQKQQIEILYNIIEKFKGQPIYTNDNSQPSKMDAFTLDLDLTNEELTITEEESLSDEDLEATFLRNFG